MARQNRANVLAIVALLVSFASTVLTYIAESHWKKSIPTTSTPLPSPAPTHTPDPVDDALARAIRGLTTGAIAFEYPETMKLDETKTVKVRISETRSKELTEGLSENGGHVQVEDIKIAPEMVTTLKGSAFEITPITSEEQIIAPDQPTSWAWSIHPTDWGHQSLYLAVCVRFELPKREERRCASVYQKDIAVQVNPMYAATHFVKNNATWTLGVIGSGFSALAGGLVLLSKRMKKAKGTVLIP